MHLEKLLKTIEGIFPQESAIEGDRIGLQIQSGKEEITSILITLEVNDDVLDKAEDENFDCIITFHPLIYHPLTSINLDDRVGRICSRLIKRSITLIVIHTNFDAYPSGTSKIFAEKIGVENIEVLLPDKRDAGVFITTKQSRYGIGIRGQYTKPIEYTELIERVSAICSSPIRYCIGKNKIIQTIGVIGGSGSSFLSQIEISSLDALITADLTYHTFQQYNRKLMLIDPGHYEMEQFVPEGMAWFLKQQLIEEGIMNISSFGERISLNKVLTNPVRYYPDSANYRLRQEKYLLKLNTDGE